MNRNQRLNFVLDGDLADALSWEAARRETNTQNLIEDLLEKTCSDLLSLWKRERTATNLRQLPSRVTPVEAVLKMSYGPSEQRKKQRAGRGASRRLT